MQQTPSQQTATHAGARLVEHRDQGGLAALAHEHRVEQFQVADGDAVQDHRVAAFKPNGTLEVFERGALGVAQIMEHRAGRADGERAIAEAAAVERKQVEMLFQEPLAVVGGEGPGVEFGAHAGRPSVPGRGPRRQQHFADPQRFERSGRLRIVHFRDAELTGGDVHESQGTAPAGGVYCGKKIILVRP